MRVSATSSITHLCPYKQERDFGTVEISWTVAPGSSPVELHALAEKVQSFTDVHLTHEAVTWDLHQWIDGLVGDSGEVGVVTRWVTAGMDVEVRA